MNLQNNFLISSLNTEEFQKSLKAAHIPVPAAEYLLLLILGTVLAGMNYILIVNFLILLEIEINPISFLPLQTTAVLLFFVLVLGIFLFAYMYPQTIATGRKTKIELELPYAITYMQALSTTMTLFSIFKSVAENKDLYGEVSEECGMIVRDVEYFGDDLLTAMRNLQEYTPSPNFSELLNDLAMVFKTGGSMTDFFASKSAHFRETAMQELENTLKTMEIMAEIYVTAFVAGPIAIMIMIVAQNLSGQSTIDLLEPLMYIGLPIGATAMIFLLYIMMPPDSLSVSKKEVAQAEYIDTNIEKDNPEIIDDKFLKNLQAKKQAIKIKSILRNPLRYYVSDYQYGLVFGMLLAFVVLLLHMNGFIAEIFPDYSFEAFICIMLIAFMLPITFAYEARNWYLKRFESQLPGFLREISDMKDMGMTLQSAIHIIAQSKIGVLTSEVKIASEEIKMGTSVSGALYKLEERIGLVSVKRAISLVIKASEITDHLREILAIAVGDLEHYLKMKNERFGVSFIYVAIIYLSYGIFLYSAYQLNVSFVESFKDFDINFNLAANISEMFHISIILGFFSGIMAGQLSSNNILAGLKHSMVFMAASLVLFAVIIQV
ncbi:type II secretion system F family protein [Methanomicrobium antiquum]|uniref:Type II secretion system F family protein n=1 Tax=Methanomicrobium antiquum TaxID=487686 RepID=A0AAF0JNE8_9EURY|nr:type II secretion system F family protein [Methanomicrobium antiquum]WFN37346.1 type II secretion system F family protein [Methanomicrobium antiquum]